MTFLIATQEIYNHSVRKAENSFWRGFPSPTSGKILKRIGRDKDVGVVCARSGDSQHVIASHIINRASYFQRTQYWPDGRLNTNPSHYPDLSSFYHTTLSSKQIQFLKKITVGIHNLNTLERMILNVAQTTKNITIRV